MGNRKLRKQLAQELKSRGVGRLYRGNKREAWRYYHASTIHRFLQLMDIEVGDVVNDCDGFNHRVAELITFYRTKSYTLRSAVVASNEQFKFDDDRMSCGCPYGPDNPWSVEDIESFFRSQYHPENIACMKDGGWWTENDEKMLDALSKGQRICDDLGMKI